MIFNGFNKLETTNTEYLLVFIYTLLLDEHIP